MGHSIHCVTTLGILPLVVRPIESSPMLRTGEGKTLVSSESRLSKICLHPCSCGPSWILRKFSPDSPAFHGESDYLGCQVAFAYCARASRALALRRTRSL